MQSLEERIEAFKLDSQAVENYILTYFCVAGVVETNERLICVGQDKSNRGLFSKFRIQVPLFGIKIQQ